MKVTVGILVCFLLATLATSLSLRRSNVRSGQGKTTPSELHGVMPRLDKNISKAGPKLKLFGAVPKGSVKMKTPISHGKCVKIAAPKVCTGTEDFYYGTVGWSISIWRSPSNSALLSNFRKRLWLRLFACEWCKTNQETVLFAMDFANLMSPSLCDISVKR